MTEYLFVTDKFGLSEKCVHFLRGGYNYETLDFILIDSIVIDKGPQIKNWCLALIIGLTFVIASVYVIVLSFVKHEIHLTGIGIELAILPIFLGGYAIYQSTKRDYIFKISYNNKTISLPIEQLKRKGEIGKLIKYLTTNILTKSKVTITFDKPET